MPKHQDFRRFGLFTIEGFLEPGLCARLRTEALAASQITAQVTRPAGDTVIDESYRRTRTACVSAATIDLVSQRLLAIKNALEDHFRTPIKGGTDPNFLVYRKGDFFRYHEDVVDTPDHPPLVRDRKISVVIFLNGEGEPGGVDNSSYGGGQLTLYRLMDFANSARYGMPLVGEEGLLVAFRSDLPHEVTEVTHGNRYTIVNWFLRDPAREGPADFGTSQEAQTNLPAASVTMSAP
jgi:SM-20-related protein